MKKEQLLYHLNWFYSLELSQVQLYAAQSKSFKNKNISISLFFDRFATIEEQHVNNIRESIKDIGGSPSQVVTATAPLLGEIAGNTLVLSGLQATLKLNAFLESKAINHYKFLIKKLNKNQSTAELVKILQHNMIDESLHAAWFQEELRKIQQNN